MLININTQSTEVPQHVGATVSPTFEILMPLGWRNADETIPLEGGYERTWIQDPENEDRAIPSDTLISERLERELQEKISSFIPLIPTASVFKLALRRNFGVGAETNKAVTMTAVANYFTMKQMNGTITTQELADAIMLDRLFKELETWNGTGETWTLPWEMVP